MYNRLYADAMTPQRPPVIGEKIEEIDRMTVALFFFSFDRALG
jgi:hypothetical protein